MSVTVRVVPILAMAVMIVGLQVWSGAYRAEFSTPDESAHFVTGLMIRDYIAKGFSERPMQFAIDYYVHYPKVAFGAWPPLFHIVEALWLLAWPASRTSVMMLLAVITFLVAWTLYETARRRWGSPKAFGLVLLLIAMPLSQFLTNRVLADSLIGLFDLWATLCWARYLDRARTTDALAFGVLAGLSMLTKQNGLALLLVPILTIPLVGDWRQLRGTTFWLALGVAGVIGGPAELYSLQFFVGTDLGGTARAHLATYLHMVASELGPAVWPLTLLGAILIFGQRSRRPTDGFWSAIVALPLALLLFHPFTPNRPSSRYLWAGVPSLLLLAGYAADWLATLASASRRRWFEVALATGVGVVFCGTTFAISRKAHVGFDAVAQAIADLKDCHGCVILASSRLEREGMFIAEVAMRDRRPQHIILRADKMLSRSDWIGAHYVLLHSDPEEIQKWLMAVPVKLVVMDNAGSEGPPHHDLLLGVLRTHGSEWQRIGAPSAAYPPEVAVYRNVKATERNGQRIEIDLGYSLGRTVATTTK
jgi:hypothetical protein